MAKVKTFQSSFGMSLEIKGVWHKFGSAIEVEIEEQDDFDKVKRMAHDTVQLEVEKQIHSAMDAMSDSPASTIIEQPQED